MNTRSGSKVAESHFLGSIKLQQILNLFVFLLAFPAVEVLGNSLYFYLFLYLLWKTYKRVGYSIKSSKFTLLLFLSWVFGVISTVFHPPLEAGEVSTLSTVTMVIRYGYWFAIGAFFFVWVKKMDLFLIAKWITIGYVCQVLGFYLFSVKMDTGLFSISTGLSRNAFVFNSIIFSGFLYYYFINRYGKNVSIWVSLFILLNLLLTNGRAGAVVGLIIVIINSALINPGLRFLAKSSVILALVLGLTGVLSERNLAALGLALAPYAEKVNPRFASLLRGEGEGDLDFDKSWLIRELMVEKTIEILSKYPVLGIGFSNFTNYSAELGSLSDPKYRRLGGHDANYYNTRSAHNSYANHLGETGLVGGLLLLLLIAPVLWWYINNFWSGQIYSLAGIMFIVTGFIGSIIHAYSITAFTGANFWFMLGVSSFFTKYKSVE